jgi:hypothetical protein
LIVLHCSGAFPHCPTTRTTGTWTKSHILEVVSA